MKRKNEMKLLQTTSPSGAYNGLKDLASTFSFTDYEKQIRQEMYQLTKDRNFQNAIQAEKAYIRACAMLKKRSGRKKEVSSSTIKSVTKMAEELKRRYPDLPYSQQLEQKLKDLKKS
jgi:hypothetical protein